MKACRDVSKLASRVRAALEPLDEVLEKASKPKADVDGVAVEVPERATAFRSRVLEASYAEAHAVLDALATWPEEREEGQEAAVEAEAESEEWPRADATRALDACVDLITQATSNAKEPRFIQLRVRLARRAGRLATALALMDALSGEDDASLGKLPDPTSQRGVMEDRIAVLSQLEWDHVAERAASVLEESFPREYPVF